MFGMQFDVGVQMLQRYYAMGCSHRQGAGEDPTRHRQTRLKMTGLRDVSSLIAFAYYFALGRVLRESADGLADDSSNFWR